jgi:peptide/nickel transport system permease protein
MSFLLRRALNSLLLLVAASALAFVLVGSAPGDFFDPLKLNPEISGPTIAGLRSEYGLNRSLPARYFHWVRSVLGGDWGFSFAYNRPAGPILWSRASNTLLLTGTATLLAWMTALPLGIWAAARPGGVSDVLVRAAISVLLATPELVLALLLLLFAIRTGILPAGGLMSTGNSGTGFWAEAPDVAAHILLPGCCLAAGLLPMLLSHIRTATSEALALPFVTAARGYGIPFRRVLLRHALPAAANPLISLFGLSLGLLISSSLLVEAVFSWPGVGQLMLQAILQRDFFLVVDSAVLGAGFLVLGNFLADVLLYVNDPRIRGE